MNVNYDSDMEMNGYGLVTRSLALNATNGVN